MALEEKFLEEVATEEVAMEEVAFWDVATEEVDREEVALEELATDKEEDMATVASFWVAHLIFPNSESWIHATINSNY